ncbi:MAG: OmpH family outer membrane protein [Bacteroidales bacterium]|jgi:outer membrane protein|nr:OmpH family outer membrane protein [Bacteroidales bacterium]
MNTVKSLLIAALALVGLQASAQTMKFAHIETQKFMSELPEYIAATKTLQEEAKKLEDQLTVMRNDLQAKYQDYIQNRDSLPDLIRATREKEIQDADQRIQSYTQMAQQSLSQKEQQLLQPLQEKVTNAIEAVGKEQGFVYIFDISTSVILYHSEESIDATPFVKAKLGL